MSNFVGTLLSICIHFFLVFLKFLLILILYKLDNSYIFPLGKTVMLLLLWIFYGFFGLVFAVSL